MIKKDFNPFFRTPDTSVTYHLPLSSYGHTTHRLYDSAYIGIQSLTGTTNCIIWIGVNYEYFSPMREWADLAGTAIASQPVR